MTDCPRCQELQAQIDLLHNTVCPNCGRLLPADGDCYGCAYDREYQARKQAEADRDTWKDTARHHQEQIEKYWSKRVKELEARNERQAKRIAQFLALSEAGVPEKVDLIEDLEQQCAALAAKLEQAEADRDMWMATATLHQEQVKEAEAREGELRDALEDVAQILKDPGKSFLSIWEAVWPILDKALSRRCSDCDGTGIEDIDGNKPIKCSRCNGTGHSRPAILDRVERLEKALQKIADRKNAACQFVDEHGNDCNCHGFYRAAKIARQALEGSEGE